MTSTPQTTIPIAMDGRRWSMGREEHASTEGWPMPPRRFLCIELRNHDEEIACARALANQEGRR